ncbi:hydroxyacylglutathione hydrolase [Thiomonas sp.]|jgi:hydroxyacylglutathione hydrolase|uniref:hydroxyacylglutathione hydrolase n=1 Tax=Thiomonas sp. TaxID=2047785 RepID=UPI00261CDBCB|nr:hydroxyacylglutathione hydrolase [Thiomonas sp.]
MHIVALQAFRDNYIWMIHDSRSAVVVDPGDAGPVLAACAPGGLPAADGRAPQGLQLAGILVTHHHPDHTGGIAELLRHRAVPVWGPAGEDIGGVSRQVGGGDSFELDAPRLRFDVLDVPGHTLGHIAYHCPSLAVVLCGDTLFSAGCGRLFEGTPGQMLESLERLGSLPDNTQVLCAHEYTVSNLQFARRVEPGNADTEEYERWCLRQRSELLPTLPSSIARERRVNPFLRSDQPGIRAQLREHFGRDPVDRVDAFAMLRQWKNDF